MSLSECFGRGFDSRHLHLALRPGRVPGRLFCQWHHGWLGGRAGMLYWDDISYLRRGNERQQDAFQALIELDIFSILAEFDPVLSRDTAAGTRCAYQ